MKILWFDVETAGLDPVANDIVTFSAMIEENGKLLKGIHLEIQPINWDSISPKALEVNGLSIDQLKTFTPPKEAHQKLLKFLSQYVNKFNKKDKFQPAGYNVGFDMAFLAEFFKKVGDKYFGSWVDYHKIDVSILPQLFHLNGALDLDSYRLESVANHLGIKIDAHDSKSDIMATRAVYYKFLENLEFKKV